MHKWENYHRLKEYYHNPNVNKPMDEIFADLNCYTNEVMNYDENYSALTFFVLLPPLFYKGKFLKGLSFVQGVDLVQERYPRIKDVMFSMAFSMSCSYPWSECADAYFASYKNEAREEWFRRTYPNKANKLLLPTEDGEYINEYLMAPTEVNINKDIDVLCVARLIDLKNMPLIAEALKIYREKYPEKKIKMTAILGKEFGMNHAELDADELAEMRKIESILVHPTDYIEFVPKANYLSIANYYSRAKVTILGTLLEGKNRALFEAMSCDSPVICFKDFNKYQRAGEPAFPAGGGLEVPEFSAESMADTIHEVLQNQDKFTPRKSYLETYGRKNFFNRCIDAFPYYKENLPGYQEGNHINNLWLELAIQENYQIGLTDFIYDKNSSLSWAQDIEDTVNCIKFYVSRYDYFKEIGVIKNLNEHEKNDSSIEMDENQLKERIFHRLKHEKINNIQIDSNGFCGSKCWYCPVRYEDRPNPQIMKPEFFRSIIEQIKKGIERDFISPEVSLWLSSYNDVLIDPHLKDRLDTLREAKLKFCAIVNGIGLLKNADLVDSYRDVINGFTVNLPAGNAEDYAKYTNNSPEVFNTIIEGLKKLHSLDPKYYNDSVLILVNGVSDDECARKQINYDIPVGDTDKQIAQLRELLPFTQIVTNKDLCDRAGKLKELGVIDNTAVREKWCLPQDAKIANGCNNLDQRPYNWLHISSTGGIYTCCHDYKEKYEYGNLNGSSLENIIFSQERANAIYKTLEELCMKCIYAT